jgi:hypothetical protein
MEKEENKLTVSWRRKSYSLLKIPSQYFPFAIDKTMKNFNQRSKCTSQDSSWK